jgi:hypothetical protein
MLRNAKSLKGFRLGALDGEIGRVRDFYFDDQMWTIRYLIADTGRWLPERLVLISPHALKRPNAEDNVIDVALTKRQIEDSPSINTDMPVSRQHEMDYHRYYGWPPYWDGPGLWGSGPFPIFYGDGGGTVESRVHRVHQGDPHLRSVSEVLGNHIQAKDGEIGHVEDFIFDDENWAIRYMEIDTRNWWPGKKVLIAPQWIENVSWEKSKVFVDLTLDTIKGAPEYDPTVGISRDYERRLFEHHHREAYWQNEVPAEEYVQIH